MKKKVIILMLTFVLAICCVAGGTLAWLTATTDTVANTFTTSDISIELTETKGEGTDKDKSFKMVPGYTIDKDPKVTVKSGSEKCYLFVKVVKSTTLDTYITYTMNDGWTSLENNDGVFYRVVDASDADQSFDVIANNTVSVKGTVTKTDMEALDMEGAVQPTLSFTAYACQYMKNNTESFTAAEAWNQVAPKN